MRFSHTRICPAVEKDGVVVGIERGQAITKITVKDRDANVRTYMYDSDCKFIHVKRNQDVQEGDVMATYIPDGRFNSISDVRSSVESDEIWNKYVQLVVRSTARSFQGRPAYRLEFVDPQEAANSTILCTLAGIPKFQKFEYSDPSELVYRFTGQTFNFLDSYWHKFRRKCPVVNWVRFLHGVGALLPGGNVQVGGAMTDPCQSGYPLTRYDRYAGTAIQHHDEIRRTTNVNTPDEIAVQ
jgi:hypothetical protein